jgi:hypothetical protein
MRDKDPACIASDQLRQEIHTTIRRYAQESDVTLYQALGVLDVVKIDLVALLEAHNSDEPDDDEPPCE